MSAHCTNNSQLVQQGVCGVAVFFVAQGSRFPGGLGIPTRNIFSAFLTRFERI